MTKHKHAELMMQYAQDAMETNKPWERWQFMTHGMWLNLVEHPLWNVCIEYRRKPKTININGYEVPEPVREALEYDEEYFCVSLVAVKGVRRYSWEGEGIDMRLLKHGLIHRTKEAAELHAKALLSFTEREGEK